MDIHEKLSYLGKRARFDLCGDCDLKGTGRRRAEGGRWDYPELVPDGEKSVMLRVLLSNRCENSCYFCENAAYRDFREATLEPDELAQHYASLYRCGRARSLFLSSAVLNSTDYTMSRILDTLELIRFRHRIPGYIHTKVLPGTSDDLIRRVIALSTRVSVNLEVPNQKRMERIGSPKNFHSDLYDKVRHISRLLHEADPAGRRRSRPKTQTTQFVVGVSGETDQELLDTCSHLYNDLHLARIYFSAFQPPGKIDFGAPRAPLLREHRLYQCDFLLRKYDFSVNEIPLDERGHLAGHEDPKTTWAKSHPAFFPLEINTAPRRSLLRVPGLGPISVKKIIAARKTGKITSKVDLKELAIRPWPALSYLLLDGYRVSNESTSARQNLLQFEA